MRSADEVRTQTLAFSPRVERTALRALATMRHPGSRAAQQRFLRRYRKTGVDGVSLTPEERERLGTLRGVEWLAFHRGPWGAPPTPLTPRILALTTQARACLRRQRWDDARRLWREAEGYDELERDHQAEKQLAGLRSLAAHGAKSRAALRRATRPRQDRAAGRRARIIAEAIAVARDWRNREPPNKSHLAAAVKRRLEEKADQSPEDWGDDVDVIIRAAQTFSPSARSAGTSLL